ncbi:MAG TPA: HAMP domain-containing sensor histidine kinase [Alphaproteobacteria bacterium]|jgi:signal transduction histidine kinase|nr:HAMP domain-containing sensor histidine kinase [Alphaproteobacteria bacterium]
MRRRLSVGTILLMMNLVLLALPLSGILALRLYESALIRQTESELIAQGALVAASYHAVWRANGGAVDPADPPVDPRWSHLPGFDGPWLPRFPALDLSRDAILPPPPDPAPTTAPADAAALKAGESLTPVLAEAQRMTLAGMRVMDRHGIVVASTGEAVGASLASQQEVRRALNGEPVSVIRGRAKGSAPGYVPALDLGSTVRVFTAMPVVEGDRVIGVILASRTPESIAEALYGKRWHLLALLGILLITVAVFAFIGVTVIARPLRAVTDQAKRTADGERGALLPAGGPMVREVGDLWQTLMRMADSMERRTDYIRDFAAHVSHEFKTPLTTIRGTVELLREHLDEMSAGERARFLANLDVEAGRMTALVSRLLELARADVMRAKDGEASKPAEILDRLKERYSGTGLRLVADIRGDIRLAMGEEALETILVNLVDNALHHAGPAPEVTIVLRREGGVAVLTVADNGPGIAEANLDKVFDPFFTLTRNQGGTGLGLAIVRGLVTAHNGRVSALPSPSGALFRIELPAA